MKDTITMTIDPDVLYAIDLVRGIVPRSTYVNAKLKEIFRGKNEREK